MNHDNLLAHLKVSFDCLAPILKIPRQIFGRVDCCV